MKEQEDGGLNVGGGCGEDTAKWKRGRKIGYDDEKENEEKAGKENQKTEG